MYVIHVIIRLVFNPLICGMVPELKIFKIVGKKDEVFVSEVLHHQMQNFHYLIIIYFLHCDDKVSHNGALGNGSKLVKCG